MFRKWEVPLRIEKSQCRSCLKKKTKQELKNYRPISLLPDSGKIFERLLYDSMLKFITKNSLILQKQSVFKTDDQFLTCTNQY